MGGVDTYFAYPYDGAPFEQFGAAHQAALLVIFLVAFSFWFFRRHYARSPAFRFGLAGLLVVNEIGWHLWHAAYGLWNIQNLLPLNLCNLLVFASAYALVTKNQLVYDFVYLLGIPAASQVLLTPALGQFGFPHILFFQIFISHGGVVLAAVYLTQVEQMRPAGWTAVRRVVAWTTLYVIGIFCLNPLIGGNYLFLAHKPPAATLIDYLGDWPWYVISMEIIGLILVILLYTPFALFDHLRQNNLKS